MKTSHELFVKITARSDGMNTAFRRAEQDMRRFSDGLKRLGRGSYLGRLITDLRKVREESRAAWRQMSTLEKTQHRLRQAGGMITGAAAGAMVLREPVKKTMDYDRRLAHLVNIGYSELDVAGRIAQKSSIDAIIQEAVRSSGIKRDNAIGAAENILAAESNIDLLKPILDTALKGSVALDAEAADVSQILLASSRSLKISKDNFENALDIVTSSTGLGNFEANDLARHLPQQMPLSANVLGQGLLGLNKLTALNQVARMNAGNSDEAANNVVNILQKLTSVDTKKALHDQYKSRLKIIGFNVDDMYVKGQLDGKDKLQVFDEVLDRLVREDERSQEILKKVNQMRQRGDTDDQIYSAIEGTLEGSVIQSVLRDRQALFGFLAYKNNKSMYDKIIAEGNESAGAMRKNFGVIQATDSWKTDQATNEWEIATQKAFKPFNEALGTAAAVVTNFAQSFPNAAAVMSGAGYTTAAAAAAGIGGSIAMKGLGGTAAGKAAGQMAGKAGSTAIRTLGSAGRGMLNAKTGIGLGLLFHSEELNKGETDRIIAMKQQYAAGKGLDAKRLAMGIGPEVGKQAGEAINQAGQAAAQGLQQAGQAVSNNADAVGKALIAQVGQTKIQGQINVSVSASPMLQVQTTAVGNGNTTLNVGKTNTGAK